MSKTPEPKELDAALFAKAAEVFANIPFVRLVGMELTAMHDGAASVKLKMRDELRQPHGLLHGGATASLIDTAMAFAVVTKLAGGEKASTVDLNVHYLRPIFDGEIFCTATVIKAGKRLLTVSAEVLDNKEKLIATALSTYTRV